MPDPGRQPPDATFLSLVAECLDRLEAEGGAAVDELCRRHPSHAAALRDHVGRLGALGLAAAGAAPPSAAVPERLGPFRLLSRLGGGGMGVVYVAEQEGLQRRVALKLVRPELLFFAGARERFRREVAAVARLAHPGIVPVFAGGEDQGVPWLAMELVRGATLDEALAELAGRAPATLRGADLLAAVEAVVRRREDGAPPRPRGSSTDAARGLYAGTWSEACLRVARALAEALQHAHEQGVLHRDVKPSNVMLTPEGRVLLLDFGLAAAEGSERLTGSGAHLGSLAWMSPEQVRGEHATLDARSDVYSLGATLFEALALRTPCATGDLEDTRQRILQGRLLPLRELNPAVPRDAETVCLKAMDTDRARRYAGAAAFAADLLAALERRPVSARRAGALHKARRWAERNPARAVAVALAALLLLGGPAAYGVVQARAAERERGLNEDLQASNTRLDAALGEVRLALDRESAARGAAQRSSRRTLSAIDELLATVGADHLRELPGFEDTRRRLLERALDFYRELEAEAPGDEATLVEQARTRRSMADLLVELGRPEEAGPLYGQAVATLRTLAAAPGASLDARYTCASCISQLGTWHYEAGRLDQAHAAWDEAREALEQLVTEPGIDPGAVHDLGILLINRAVQLRDASDHAGALALYLRAAELQAGQAALHPEREEFAIEQATALGRAGTLAAILGRADAGELHRRAWELLAARGQRGPASRRLREQTVEVANNYGLHLMNQADRELAVSVLGAGLDAARALADDFPHEPNLRVQAAVLALNLAGELGNQRRIAEGAPLAYEACERLSALAAERPDVVDYPYFLGAGLGISAGMRLEQGDLEGALADASRGQQLLRGLLVTLGGAAVVRVELVSVLCTTVKVQAARGDLAAALAALDEAGALDGERPDIVFLGAEAAATLAAAARAAGAQDAFTRARHEALRLLGLALDKGWSDAPRLRLPEFAALQGDGDFEELAARLATTRP